MLRPTESTTKTILSTAAICLMARPKNCWRAVKKLRAARRGALERLREAANDITDYVFDTVRLFKRIYREQKLER